LRHCPIFGEQLIQAIKHHCKRVRFFSTVELVNTLEQEKAQGKAARSPRL
jgi:hypothetical protein